MQVSPTLQDSVSSLALASAEVQQHTTDISAQVKKILETPQAANNNHPPTMEEEPDSYPDEKEPKPKPKPEPEPETEPEPEPEPETEPEAKTEHPKKKAA